LTGAGKPIGQIVAITVPISSQKQMPIGMLTCTQKDRLIFWPVMPRRECLLVHKPAMRIPDHITVELASEKIHVTSYDPAGRVDHYSNAWRSATIQVADMRQLFTFLVRLNVVTDQDVIITRKFSTPEADNQRRIAEFNRFAEIFAIHHLPVPVHDSQGDFVYFGMFVAPDLSTASEALRNSMPTPAFAELVDGPSNEVTFPITLSQFVLREWILCMVAGFPPGKLRDDMCLGFPQRTSGIVGLQKDII
jgi:hypothetical protein